MGRCGSSIGRHFWRGRREWRRRIRSLSAKADSPRMLCCRHPQTEQRQSRAVRGWTTACAHALRARLPPRRQPAAAWRWLLALCQRNPSTPARVHMRASPPRSGASRTRVRSRGRTCTQAAHARGRNGGGTGSAQRAAVTDAHQNPLHHHARAGCDCHGCRAGASACTVCCVAWVRVRRLTRQQHPALMRKGRSTRRPQRRLAWRGSSPVRPGSLCGAISCRRCIKHLQRRAGR